MNMAVFWLVVLIVCILIEIPTLGLTTIWFAGGSLFAALVALLHLPLWLQIAVFIVVSLVLLFLTRPIAVKYFNKDRIHILMTFVEQDLHQCGESCGAAGYRDQ